MSRIRHVLAGVALGVVVIGSTWSLTPALYAVPQAHVDISTPTAAPRKITHSVAPMYPPRAVDLGIEADIDLTLTVNPTGDVVSTENVLSNPMIRPDDQGAGARAEFVADNPWAFNDAAAAAARRWTFESGPAQWKSVFEFKFRLASDANQTTDVGRPSIGSPAPSNISGSARPGDVLSAPPSSTLRVGKDLKAPRKIVDVQPLYPEDARAAMAKGVVLLDVTIGADGSVAGTRVLRSIPLLDQAAIDAVSQWKFEPTVFHSVPVAVQMLIYVNFVPPGRPVRVGGAVKAPLKIGDVKPIYPEEARAAQVSGAVVIQVIIATDGSVSNTRVVRSIPMLDQAAIDAVKQWRFEPTMVNGVLVELEMNVVIDFTPE